MCQKAHTGKVVSCISALLLLSVHYCFRVRHVGSNFIYLLILQVQVNEHDIGPVTIAACLVMALGLILTVKFRFVRNLGCLMLKKVTL